MKSAQLLVATTQSEAIDAASGSMSFPEYLFSTKDALIKSDFDAINGVGIGVAVSGSNSGPVGSNSAW